MELASTRLLPVDRETAWRALNDPEALKAAIPGCESIEPTGENEYAVAMTAAIGPVRAKFRGKLVLSDIVVPERYTIHFEGQGGPAGFGKGSASVELADEGGQTRLTYKVTAQVGGRIAQVGQRLIDAAAGKIADDFFAAFSSRLAPEAGIVSNGAVPASTAPLWIAFALLALLVAFTLLMR
jgi:carbon monoxide dehydrogenase subunit G